MPITITSVPNWDPVENLPWNDTQRVTGMNFESIGDSLADAAEAAKTAAMTEIVQLKVQTNNQLTQLNAPQTVVDASDAIFDFLTQIVEVVIQGLADALRALDPDVVVLYTAKSGCPVDSGDFVKFEDAEFDPPILPEYNLDLKITISVPGVFSLEIPFPIKVNHHWEFTKPTDPVETQIDSVFLAPGEGEVEGWRKRVWSEYRYKLKYTASLTFGPWSGSLDAVWWREQKAYSEWCPR